MSFSPQLFLTNIKGKLRSLDMLDKPETILSGLNEQILFVFKKNTLYLFKIVKY